MPKVGIIYNDSKPTACRAATEIKDKLIGRGLKVCTAPGTGGILGYATGPNPLHRIPMDKLAPPDFDQEMMFAIVLGGDGTVLSASRQLAPHGIPLLAVNTGHMGFLTETYLNQLPSVLEQVIDVLHREPMTCMCHFEIKIGRHAPVDIAADGVIISTPTGSTAYCLSAGGAVVTPGVEVLQLLPICPHSLASRALIYGETEPVIIYPASPNQLVMVVDGNGGCYVLPEYQVKVKRSPYRAKFIRLQPPEFFQVLREKLGWGLPHIAKPTSVELP